MVEQVTAKAGIPIWGIFLAVIILLAIGAELLAKSGKVTWPRHSSVRVAMCQIFVLDGDREGNFVRIENAISEAKAAGAEIACLPESIILGWVNPDAHKRAQAIPSEDSIRLCQLAKKYKVYVCAGLDEKDGDKLYGAALLIDDSGRILLKHRKLIVLPELMEPPYTAGSDVNAVAETRFGRIGLLICADTHRDEILEQMAKLKPDLLLVPYGYAEEEQKWPNHGKQLEFVVRKAASRTGAAVVGTDCVGVITKGPWAGRVYGGHSIAADRSNKTIAVAKDRDRDIKIVLINTGR